jgi:methyl-accepting chemotaxis protein-1 (serine sensor receptor)
MLSLLLVAVGAAGLAGMARSHADLLLLHEERLSALGHLDSMMSLMLRNQLVIVQAAYGEPAALPEAVIQVERNRDAISKLWQEYSESFASDQEREMAERFEAAREHFMLDTLAPALVAAKAGDIESMRALANGPVAHQFPTLRAELDKLIAFQLQHGRSHYLQAEERHARLRTLVFALLAAGLAAAAILGYRLERRITVPLKRALGAAQAVARGDLAQRFDVTSNDETGKLLGALKEMSASLAGMAGNVRRASDGIHSAASCIADGDHALSRRIEEQAGAVEETAASLEQLTQTVMRNADNARQVNLLAQSAAHVATRGGAAVFQAVEKMRAISASSLRIADIMDVIDGIASQTGQIAQGATARAAGKGDDDCAAVAAEVRGLAQRTAAAALEVRQLITHSMEQVNAGSTLVNQAGYTIGEVVQAVHRVSGIINEITAASHEQSLGIGQLNLAMLQMDAATQQNAALFEQASAAAASMQAQALALARAVAVLRLPVPAANKPQSHQISLVSPQSYC